MKLLTKLTLFISLSKLAMVALFVLLLPMLVNKIGFEYTNFYLQQQKQKVLQIVQEKGIDYYLQGETGYGSYTLLKEEYISLEPATPGYHPDTIETAERVIESDTINYRLLTHVFKNNNKDYVLEIGKNTATIGQYNRPLQRVALYVLIGLIAISLVVDLVFTRLFLRPLGTIIREKLVNQQFPFTSHKKPVKTTTTDFRYLDESLAALMSRINEDFEKEKQFTANASHELMTPISILQSKMENLLFDETLNEAAQVRLSAMMRTLNRLKKIVNSLLLISRIENEQYIRKDNVAISALMDELNEELGDRISEKKIVLSLALTPGIILHGVNRDLIFQLLYNLLNNAVRYNKIEGTIIIRDNYSSGNNYVLEIYDTGQGISTQELGSVFDRFKKGENAQEGNGLGLSIVKSIALYHRATVTIDSIEGKGTSVFVTFQQINVSIIQPVYH